MSVSQAETMAVAFAFEGKAAESAKYYQQVFDRQMKANAPDAAAGTANALARVYLETGDLANAEKWYRTGYETSQKIEKLTPEDKELRQTVRRFGEQRLRPHIAEWFEAGEVPVR